MKHLALWIVVVGLVLGACKKQSNNDFSLTVKIKGLKKGIAYLESYKDGLWTVIDSISILGERDFTFGKRLDHAQLLRFSINHDKKHTVHFFAENLPMRLNAVLEKMSWKKQVSGSKNDSILQLLDKQLKELNFRKLKLVEERFKAVREKDTETLTKIDQKEKKMVRNQYLFTINFALRNKDYEIAPYIALNYLQNVNTRFLDTIANSLNDKVKNGFHGKKLAAFIKKRKAEK